MRTRLLFLFFLFSSFLLAAGQTVPDRSNGPATIRNVTFQNATLLSQEDKQQIINAIKKKDDPGHVRTLHDLVEEAHERTKLVYQRDGYFKANVTAQSFTLSGNSEPVDIAITVVDQGRQYRLGAIHWKGMSAVSEQELSDLMPLHPGEVVNRDKIAQGLEQVQKFYNSKGYMKQTMVPSVEFDEKEGNITLDIKIDEGA